MATTMMHIRVDEEVKAQAARTLDELGLSVSDAVRLFLKRVVVEERLPLILKIPSARTRAAIAEAEALHTSRFASAEDLLNHLEKAAA